MGTKCTQFRKIRSFFCSVIQVLSALSTYGSSPLCSLRNVRQNNLTLCFWRPLNRKSTWEETTTITLARYQRLHPRLNIYRTSLKRNDKNQYQNLVHLVQWPGYEMKGYISLPGRGTVFLPSSRRPDRPTLTSILTAMWTWILASTSRPN